MKVASRFSWFDAALLTTAAFFSVVAVAAATIAPKHEGDGVAVVFAPWTGAGDSLSRAVDAGGRFVRFGAFDFIAVVEPEAAGYGLRARSRGAWLLADPSALAACLKPFLQSKI